MISSGVVEGFSGEAKLTDRKAYGLRTPQGIEIALFHPMRNPTRAENIPPTLLRSLLQRAASEGSFSHRTKCTTTAKAEARHCGRCLCVPTSRHASSRVAGQQSPQHAAALLGGGRQSRVVRRHRLPEARVVPVSGRITFEGKLVPRACPFFLVSFRTKICLRMDPPPDQEKHDLHCLICRT